LRRLPRDGLARRCEPFVLVELDEALGTRPAPRRRYLAPEHFEERIELEAETGSCALLVPPCAQLLARLAHFLRVRVAGVTRLAFSFRHRERRSTVVRLGRALPGGEAGEWQLLLEERLARTRLPAPVVAVGLRSAVTVPLPAASGTLPGVEAGTASADAWALLDRLRARLGAAAVSGVCLVPEHRPERAFRCVSPQPSGRAEPATPSLPCAPRPLWLLATPERLGVRHGQPCHDGPLRIESGPERIESGWWDGSDVARDYYVAATRAGVRLWIYRERRPAGAAARHWFLHGVFG
jgi:protein ImuB